LPPKVWNGVAKQLSKILGGRVEKFGIGSLKDNNSWAILKVICSTFFTVILPNIIYYSLPKRFNTSPYSLNVFWTALSIIFLSFSFKALPIILSTYFCGIAKFLPILIASI
jgi:hypothetical protein